MLDREIGLAGIYPDLAAQVPPAGEARVERERTVDQPDHGLDLLAEIREHEGGVGEDAWVILRSIERLPSEIAGLTAGCLRIFDDEAHVTDRCPSERRSVMPIDRDCLLEQPQGLDGPLFCYWK